MKVLVLSRNYPNDVLPYLGLWVRQLVQHTVLRHTVLPRTLPMVEARVIAPIPYSPPLPMPASYASYRSIPPSESDCTIQVYHPRLLAGPGYSLHNYEARLYLHGIQDIVDSLRTYFPFDLIHAHFGYPDGVVAAHLAQRYNVPFVITEHAFWRPWMDAFPRVRQQAVQASLSSAYHVGVSRSVVDSIASFTGNRETLRVISVGVDGDIFRLPPDGGQVDPNLLLYAGRIHPTKGVDVLLHAFRLLLDRQPGLRLVLAGGSLYPKQNVIVEQMKTLALRLGLGKQVEFIGPLPMDELATWMQRCALLVLPSRRETFGSVLVEAMACGRPVVATRCGGPEEFITDQVGSLAPVENPGGLAEAVASVLARLDDFDPADLRAYALDRFSWEHVVAKTLDLYNLTLQHSIN